MAIKLKPEVKNEVICENVLTLDNEDPGQKVRVALQYNELLKMEVYQPTEPQYRNVLLLFTREDVEAIIKLWEEWKDQDDIST